MTDPNPIDRFGQALQDVGTSLSHPPAVLEQENVEPKPRPVGWIIATIILATMLVLATVSLLLVNANTYNELEATQATLAQTQTDLTNTQAQLATAQTDLQTAKADLETAKADAASQRANAAVSSQEAQANKAAAVEGLECIGTLLESSSNIFDNPEYALQVLQNGQQQCKDAISKLQTLKNSQGV